MTAKKKAVKKQALPVVIIPTGVYLDHNAHSAIAVKQDRTGMWFLTIETGEVTVRHLSVDRFTYKFRRYLPDYPVHRAVRKYQESGLARDERAHKLMRVLMRS